MVYMIYNAGSVKSCDRCLDRPPACPSHRPSARLADTLHIYTSTYISGASQGFSGVPVETGRARFRFKPPILLEK